MRRRSYADLIANFLYAAVSVEVIVFLIVWGYRTGGYDDLLGRKPTPEQKSAMICDLKEDGAPLSLQYAIGELNK